MSWDPMMTLKLTVLHRGFSMAEVLPEMGFYN